MYFMNCCSDAASAPAAFTAHSLSAWVAHCATAASSMAPISGSSLTTSSTLAPIQAWALPSRQAGKAPPRFSQPMPAAWAGAEAPAKIETVHHRRTPAADVTAQPCSLRVMHSSPSYDGPSSAGEGFERRTRPVGTTDTLSANSARPATPRGTTQGSHAEQPSEDSADCAAFSARAAAHRATTCRATPMHALFPASDVVEELLHLGEKAGGMRRGLLVALALERLQQLALLAREILGRLHLHLDVHVAHRLGAQHRHALALEAELLAALGAIRHAHARHLPADGRHVHLAAQRCRGHGDRHAAEDV